MKQMKLLSTNICINEFSQINELYQKLLKPIKMILSNKYPSIRRFLYIYLFYITCNTLMFLLS